MVAHLEDGDGNHEAWSINEEHHDIVFNDDDMYNAELPLQYIHTRIVRDNANDYYWHARVRDLNGREFFLDLGNYGAVRWGGRFLPTRWLTLKE